MPEKPSKLRVALISGAAIGIVSAVPGLNLINCCCCAGVILGGVLAVYLYKQEFTADLPVLESSDALILGVLCGVVSAFVTTLLNVIILAAFGDVASELAISFVETLIERANLPPETAEQLRSQMEQSMAEQSSFMGVMTELFISLLIHPLFAMLGGLIGFSIFRPKRTIEDLPRPS
jgi:hypothetical protein